jgi:hypothetical protein
MSAGGWNLSTLTRFTLSTVLFRRLLPEIGFSLVGGIVLKKGAKSSAIGRSKMCILHTWLEMTNVFWCKLNITQVISIALVREMLCMHLPTVQSQPSAYTIFKDVQSFKPLNTKITLIA